MSCGGADNGSDVGEEIGAPGGSEPAGDLAICRGGPEFALGAVVVRGDVRVVEEGEEEVITNLAVSSAQSSAVAVGRGERHDGVEVMLEATPPGPSCDLGQGTPPPRQHDGAKQQGLHPRREDHIAGLDREFAIAELVREANFPVVGMTALRAVEIGDADGGTMAIHHLGDDAGRSARPDHMDDHLVVLKTQFQVRPAVDPHRGFVGADDPRPAQTAQDGPDTGIEALSGEQPTLWPQVGEIAVGDIAPDQQAPCPQAMVFVVEFFGTAENKRLATPEGALITPHTLGEFHRDLTRLAVIPHRIAKDRIGEAGASVQASDTGPHAMVRLLARSGGGIEAADMLVQLDPKKAPYADTALSRIGGSGNPSAVQRLPGPATTCSGCLILIFFSSHNPSYYDTFSANSFSMMSTVLCRRKVRRGFAEQARP